MLLFRWYTTLCIVLLTTTPSNYVFIVSTVLGGMYALWNALIYNLLVNLIFKTSSNFLSIWCVPNRSRGGNHLWYSFCMYSTCIVFSIFFWQCNYSLHITFPTAFGAPITPISIICTKSVCFSTDTDTESRQWPRHVKAMKGLSLFCNCLEEDQINWNWSIKNNWKVFWFIHSQKRAQWIFANCNYP